MSFTWTDQVFSNRRKRPGLKGQAVDLLPPESRPHPLVMILVWFGLVLVGLFLWVGVITLIGAVT